MPKGAEAAKLEKELTAQASRLVRLKRKKAVVWQVTRLNPDVVEVLLTDRDVPWRAWVCRSGAVRFYEGWDL